MLMAESKINGSPFGSGYNLRYASRESIQLIRFCLENSKMDPLIKG